jgi:hypothetical protein
MKRFLMFAAMMTVATAAAAQAPARRPSMVGYIEDGAIGTEFRIRFDVDQHIHDPDRSEFFYAKCGCYWGLPTNHPFYDPNAPGDRDGIATDVNARQLYFQGEYAVMNNRASIFAELPLRWLRPQAFAAGALENNSGISDLRVGAKVALMTTDKGTATGLLRVSLPTGNAGKGLGTDHASLEPTLIVSRDLASKAGVEAQVGAVIPLGGSAGLPTAGSDKFSGTVLYYGIGPSFDVYSTPRMRLSPVVELVGWRVLGGFQTGNPALASGPDAGFAEASDAAPNIVNIKIGARLTMRDMASIYIGYGRHLTDATWYDDIFRVEYRVSLGK